MPKNLRTFVYKCRSFGVHSPPPPRKAHCAEQAKRTVQNEVRKTQNLGGQSSDMVSKTTLSDIYWPMIDQLCNYELREMLPKALRLYTKNGNIIGR